MPLLFFFYNFLLITHDCQYCEVTLASCSVFYKNTLCVCVCVRVYVRVYVCANFLTFESW
jgi:hypothetical protein